jgi:hypothetical protein
MIARQSVLPILLRLVPILPATGQPGKMRPTARRRNGSR